MQGQKIKGHCRFSHDSDVVPRGEYPRKISADMGVAELVLLTREEQFAHRSEEDSSS